MSTDVRGGVFKRAGCSRPQGQIQNSGACISTAREPSGAALIPYWDELTAGERTAAVALAGASQQRALTAWPLLLFALAEQVVHLLITIAMGITFVSFGVAILFAFFKRTESIAHNIINQWIELIVQTTIIALIQALVIGFFLAGAATGSAAAIIGIGMICLVFIVITLWSGVKAVWNSFNRLFNAMSQITGGVMVAPGTAALATAGAGAVATGAAVSVGSNALAGMTALNRGATMATALTGWASTDVRANTSASDFDADLIVGQPTVVVLTCPGRMRAVYASYLGATLRKLMLDLDTIGERNKGPLPVPVGVILDEFPTLGKLDSLVADVNLVRKRRISIMIGAQAKGQFHMIYGNEGTQALFTGLATQVIYGGCDADTAEFYSKASGTATTDANADAPPTATCASARC